LHANAGIDPYLRLRDTYLRLRVGAALALLQPGIDPVFLVLLSRHSGLALADHGLVVGASQAGMAVGAVVAALAPRLSRRALAVAATAGVIASAATVLADGLLAILACRAVFGLAAGLIYTATLRAATVRAPAHAMGTIMFLQLVAATLVALVLPAVAGLAGPGAALLCLAAIPLANLALLVPDTAIPRRARSIVAVPQPIDPVLVAVFLFVAASMMVWSYIGAQAVTAGLSSQTVGFGVALGSIAAGAAALMVARGASWLPAPVSATLAALAMATPFAAPASTLGFVAAMIAFNVGATYAVARFSALAIECGDDARGLVPALQGVAMVVGPLCAAAAVGRGGFPALAAVSVLTLLIAVAMLGIDRLHNGFRVPAPSDPLFHENATTDVRGALTET
jgi:predicted MFS family arabinose efflux permease